MKSQYNEREELKQIISKFVEMNEETIFQHENERIGKMVQLSCISFKYGYTQTDQDYILDFLKNLNIITHIYNRLFCKNYAIISLKDSQSPLITLQQPSVLIELQQFSFNKNHILNKISQIFKNFELPFRIQIKPAVVKREGKYLIRYLIKKIIVKEINEQEADYQSLNVFQPKVIETELEFNEFSVKEQHIELYDKMISNKQKQNKTIAQIEKIYFELALKEANLDQPYKFSGGLLIQTKDLFGKFKAQKHSFIESLVFKSIFNPKCQDFIYDFDLKTITLVSEQSKYYNYFHFKHNVQQYNLNKRLKCRKKQFYFCSFEKQYETIPLIFTLPPMYFMQIIETPCRGQSCNHLSFYELKVLYSTRKKDEDGRQYFTCPVCNNRLIDQKIIILNCVKNVLEIVRHHERLNNYNLFEAFLTADHEEKIVKYNYATNSVNLQSQEIYSFYELLAHNKQFEDFSTKRIKNNKKYLQK